MVGIKFVGGVILKRHVRRVLYLEYPSTKPRTDFVKTDRCWGVGGSLRRYALLITALKRVDYGGTERVWCMNSRSRLGLTEAALG